MSEPLLARLVADGALSRGDAERATARQAQAGGSIDTALLELRLVPGSRLPEVLARVTGLPAPPETAFTSPDPRARRVFPAKVAERHGIAPFALDGRDLSVVTTYPPDVGLVDEIGFLLSLHLRAHVAPEWRVRSLVRDLYGTPLPERLAAIAGTSQREPAPAAPAPVRAPRWTPAQAAEALAAAPDRDAAIRVALLRALDFFSFAAVFSVRRDALAGHDAVGTDPGARDACRRLAVDLEAPGLFGAPLTARAPYLGPPPADPVTAQVLSGLGRVGPHTVLVAPVYVGERPACLLYADNDDAPVTSSRLGDLFLLLGALGASLERMIRSQKAAAPEPAAARPTGRVEVPQPPVPPAPTIEDAVANAPSEVGAPPDPAGTVEPEETPETAEPTGPTGPTEPAGPQATGPDEEAWKVSEPARVEVDPLPFSVDVDLGEYEVASAGEALASARADDLGSMAEALARSPVGSPERERLVAWLAQGGQEAAAALVARLPGPVEVDDVDPAARPVEERGPLFAAVVALGRIAEKPLLAALEDPDPPRRRAAVALLSRLGDSAALASLAARVHDEDPAVAHEAREALVAAKGKGALSPLVGDLRRALGGGRAPRVVAAARALGRLGDADAVPVLIEQLERGGEIATACADALARITLQRLGPAPAPWIAWWREWRAAPRASWLFRALEGPDRDLRELAAAELRRAGEPPVPYRPDAPEPERRRAAQAWAAWWREEGLAL